MSWLKETGSRREAGAKKREKECKKESGKGRGVRVAKREGVERGEAGIREKEHGRKGLLPVASPSHLACTLRVSFVYHLFFCGQGRRPLKLYTITSVLPIYWSKHVVDYVLSRTRRKEWKRGKS